MKTIQVYVCPLSAIVQAEMIDFASRRDYQQYKREQIYDYRDQQIARHLHTSIDALDYAVTAHGKPYLRHSTLAFNHSHSQDDYALAISDRVVDIGVDIESLNRKIRFDALAQHAFHPDEYASLESFRRRCALLVQGMDHQRSDFKSAWYGHTTRFKHSKYAHASYF